MKIRTNVRAGGGTGTHNETQVQGFKVQTNVKAGRMTLNHDELLVRG